MAYLNQDNGLAGSFIIGEETLNIFNQTSPVVGLSIRCAKDEARFTEESIANPPANSTTTVRTLAAVQSTSILTQTALTDSQIQVTPNPNSGVFKVVLTEVPEGFLQVVNINGGVVYTKQFKSESEIKINIQSQPAGVYIVQVQSQGQTISKKIIKN